MGFYLDFNKISIDMFFDYLKERRLFATHMILKENIEERKNQFKNLGYHNIHDLYQAIKTQQKVDSFSIEYDMDNQYLTVLRRHLMSLIAKPRKITDFKRLKEESITYLLHNNIKTTKDLYERINDIQSTELDYLTSIADLCRLRYLHATFLDGIYFSGYTSIKKLEEASVEELSKKINEVMLEKNLSKAKLGLKDSEYLIEDAKLYNKWLHL